MCVPDDIDYGDYNLIVYNELERAEWNTNYAGYDTLVLTVTDLNSPTVTNVYRNEAGKNFKLTASDETLSHISTLSGRKIKDLSGINTTTNLQLSESTNGIKIYDVASNISTIYTNDMQVDSTPPSVTISYNSGTYTLTVSDSESGVWKITNSNGDTIYRDYSTSSNSAAT